MTVNNTSVAPVTGSRLVIHRGYAVMSYIICNKDNMDIGERGLILYNMADGKSPILIKVSFRTTHLPVMMWTHMTITYIIIFQRDIKTDYTDFH